MIIRVRFPQRLDPISRPAARRAAGLLVALLAGCGGGGDGEPIIRESTFLAAYRYELRHDADSRSPLLLATQWGDTPCEFSLRLEEAAGLRGLYSTAGGVANIDRGSVLVADTCAATAMGTLRADVTSDLVTASTGAFTSGAWNVHSGADSVAVVVVSAAGGGVELRLNGGPSEFFGWPEFAGLFAADSAAPGWQQAASASLQFLRVTLSQVEMTFTALVDAKEAAFTSTPLVRRCSRFPGLPPAGVAVQGERAMSWRGSADLGFDLQFTDCWDDAPGDDQDYLYRGSVSLGGWRASSDGSNRLVFVGFGGDSFGSRVPGGVQYQSLTLDRATANGSGGHVLDPDTAFTLRGGFAVGFVEP